jgi:Asp/Glu/hydantoin racemase
MDALLDPEAARSALIAASKGLAAMGAETIILGCTGMAHHRPAIRDAVNIPVIEPSQAATALAMGILLGEGPFEDRRPEQCDLASESTPWRP